MKQKILDFRHRRLTLLESIIGPAKAAANQMKDAGMHRGADPLLEAIFQIEALDQEVQELIKGNPEEFVSALIDLVSGGGNAPNQDI